MQGNNLEVEGRRNIGGDEKKINELGAAPKGTG